MPSRLLKGFGVVLGAISLSWLGLYASDSVSGIDRQLASVGGLGVCPDNMVEVLSADTSLCVDQYEVSPHSACPHALPASVIATEENISNRSCEPVSELDSQPWTHVSLAQAERLCARVGKRLPTAAEWYQGALDTNVDECVLDDSNKPLPSGSTDCVAPNGAYDMIGNVWEWVDETVRDGQWNGIPLPTQGYVTAVDSDGIAISTELESANQLFGDDYFWSKSEGVFGMIRGGFYGSQEDGGLYTVNATVETSFASPGIGFRCVLDR